MTPVDTLPTCVSGTHTHTPSMAQPMNTKQFGERTILRGINRQKPRINPVIEVKSTQLTYRFPSNMFK